MFAELAANVTSSFQKTNENDHIGHAIELPMTPPSSTTLIRLGIV
jgi:hypothetical protein